KEQMPIQLVVSDFKDELRAQSPRAKIIEWLTLLGFGGLLAAVGITARSARKKEARRLKAENNKRPLNQVPPPNPETNSVKELLSLGPSLNSTQEIQLRAQITAILQEVGVTNPEQYNIHRRVLAEIHDQKPTGPEGKIDSRHIFADLQEGLEE